MQPIGTPILEIGSFLSLGIEWLFYILILIFIAHAAALSYHWFSYGSKRSISLTALAVYLSGAAILFVTMSSAMLLT